jgi:hypothetical protein
VIVPRRLSVVPIRPSSGPWPAPKELIWVVVAVVAVELAVLLGKLWVTSLGDALGRQNVQNERLVAEFW